MANSIAPNAGVQQGRRGTLAGVASIAFGVGAVATLEWQGALIPLVFVVIGCACAVYAWRTGARVLANLGFLMCAGAITFLGFIAYGFWSWGELNF